MGVLAVATETTNQLIGAGTALVGVVIGFLGTVLQNRHATAERKAEAATARRERAAAVLGRARTFLTDATPERVGSNVDADRTPQELDTLTVRLNALRDELSMLAGADEDDRVMARMGDLELALFNTLFWVRWHASNLLRNRDSLDSLSGAQWWHQRAFALQQLVLVLVRGGDGTELEDELLELDKTKPPGA